MVRNKERDLDWKDASYLIDIAHFASAAVAIRAKGSRTINNFDPEIISKTFNDFFMAKCLFRVSSLSVCRPR
jgi:hypothetical protein